MLQATERNWMATFQLYRIIETWLGKRRQSLVVLGSCQAAWMVSPFPELRSSRWHMQELWPQQHPRKGDLRGSLNGSGWN